jgi:hypothetical protein
MATPVVLLTFANDPDDHLPLLEEESRQIFNDLDKVQKNTGKIQLIRLGNTTTEDIIEHIRRNYLDLKIFHFGGHSDGTKLLLEDQAAQAQGIAQMLAQAPHLELIFLNGCANYAQVAMLRQAGVKALIIATYSPIKDDKAQLFATSFYQSLAMGMSYQKSFDFAKATLTTMGKSTGLTIEKTRFLGAIQAPNQMPWTLEYIEEKPDLLEAKLYAETIKTLEIKPLQSEINEVLLQTLWGAFAVYNEDLADKFQQARRNDKFDERKIRRQIIDCFPAPIGEKVRKVFTNQYESEDRLLNLGQAYRIAIRLYCYTLLSEVWEEYRKNPQLVMAQEEKMLLAQFFSLTEPYYAEYNYLPLITGLVNILLVNNISPFIAEFQALRDSLKPNSEFASAVLFLETLFQNQNGGIKVSANEIKTYCLNAEENLAIFLKTLAFTIHYTFKTIKRIELKKQRFKSPSYNHLHIVLDRVMDDYLEDESDYQHFTESYSVILCREVYEIKDYLNLSPLLIDANAKEVNVHKPNLYIYAYRNALNGNYYFENIDNPNDKYLVINQNSLPEIKELLDEMIQDFTFVFNQ